MKPVDRYESAEIRAYLQIKGYRPWRSKVYRPFEVGHIYWEAEIKLLNEKREGYIGGHFGRPGPVMRIAVDTH